MGYYKFEVGRQQYDFDMPNLDESIPGTAQSEAHEVGRTWYFPTWVLSA